MSPQTAPTLAPSRIAERLAAQRVRRRRELRQPLHQLGQHRDRVVDARHDEHRSLRDVAELRSFSGRSAEGRRSSSRCPTNETDATAIRRSPWRSSRSGMCSPKNSGDRRRTRPRSHDAVDDGEDAGAEQVHGAGERRHERVLDRSLPALPGDRLDQQLEDDPEVRPHHGADQEDRGQAVMLTGRRPPRRPSR